MGEKTHNRHGLKTSVKILFKGFNQKLQYQCFICGLFTMNITIMPGYLDQTVITTYHSSDPFNDSLESMVES